MTLLPDEAKDCKVQKLKAPNTVVNLDDILEYSQASEEGIADMVEIDQLNAASLLFNLGSRYKKDEIFTYVGPILLVLNPFR